MRIRNRHVFLFISKKFIVQFHTIQPLALFFNLFCTMKKENTKKIPSQQKSYSILIVL